jgi:hypothetical protein
VEWSGVCGGVWSGSVESVSAGFAGIPSLFRVCFTTVQTLVSFIA